MLAVLCTQAALVPLTISLPSSSPLATAPARAALPSHHTLSHSTQSVSNLGIFPSSETTLPVPSSLLASEDLVGEFRGEKLAVLADRQQDLAAELGKIGRAADLQQGVFVDVAARQLERVDPAAFLR